MGAGTRRHAKGHRLVIQKLGEFGEGKRRRELERLVGLVNTFEPETEDLTDEELRAKTAEFMERVEQGESLDDLLPEAFAAVREAASRTIGQRHFDVQVMGARGAAPGQDLGDAHR